MADGTDFPPLLPEGFYRWTLAEIRERCVDAYPLSTTRASFWAAFESVWKRLEEVGCSCQIWLDGSFLSEKINPSDIDFVVVVLAAEYDLGTDEMRDVLDGLIEGGRWQPPACCDTNVAFIDPPERSNSRDVLEYWRRRFGYSTHEQKPKGIVVIAVGPEEVAL